MPGFASSISNNINCVFGNNADFSGSGEPNDTNGLQTDNQIWLGSTALNAGGTHINVKTLTAGTGITFTSSPTALTISLAGGSSAIEKVALQTGTTPIIPSGGIITFNGATVSAGTHPVRTDGTGANTMALEVQISQAIASTDATKIGLSNFNSAQFSVDGNGFVSLSPQPIVTIDGDTSSITGSTVTIQTNNAANNSGASFLFVGNGTTTMNLNVSDAHGNTFIGNSCGNLSLTVGTAIDNTGFGQNVMANITTASLCTFMGFHCGITLTTGVENTGYGNQCIQNNSTANYNTGFGSQCLKKVTGAQNSALGQLAGGNFTTGTNNCLIGYSAGSNYTTSESNNIIVGANINGTIAESNVIRIGNGSNTTCFITGIDGVNVGSVAKVITEASNQLGTATITAGTGITITPTANTITIAASGSFTPNSSVQVFDDFVGSFQSGTLNALISSQTWTISATNPFGDGALSGTAPAVVAHPGIVSHAAITSGTASLFLSDDGVGNFVLGGGVLVINWVFNINALSNSTNRYVLRLGMRDVGFANAVWFEYSDNENSGNWIFNSQAASTQTNTNSSTAVTTGWHNAQITVNAGATSVNFTMDGVSLGNITTNIPTSTTATQALNAWLQIARTAGTIAACTLQVDLFYLTYTLTTPR